MQQHQEIPSTIDHYGTEDYTQRVMSALRDAGFGDGPIAATDLAPLDQFHAGGLIATAEFARLLDPVAGSSVLDVGCGLGGPARYLAATYGCSVTGIDLNRPFIDLGAKLTERTGLSAQVSHVWGDATQLPFDDGSFDFAWTQHVAMNVRDRATLYGGIFRVLRPGARFGIFDIVAGDGEPLEFPVPWASDPQSSHLETLTATRAAVEAAGFQILDWNDLTESGMRWQQQLQSTVAAQPVPSRLSLPLVMGDGFPEMVANLGRNAMAGRIGLLMGIARRPD